MTQTEINIGLGIATVITIGLYGWYELKKNKPK